MNPQSVFCPNLACPARGQQGQGNISVHSHKERRYGCVVCQGTFSATKGTLFYRLRTDSVQVMLVITLLAYGCPPQAIVQAFGFDERTIKEWWQRSGEHCRRVHEHLVATQQLDLQQVQADEMYLLNISWYDIANKTLTPRICKIYATDARIASIETAREQTGRQSC